MTEHPVVSTVDRLSSQPQQAIRELKRKAWITKSSQFAAAKRIEKLNYTSVIAISFIAIFNIASGAISIVFSENLDSEYIKILGLASIVISIYIIFISILVSGRGYDRRSYLLTASANQISELINDINCLVEDRIDLKNVRNLYSKYNKILFDYEISHEDMDFRFASSEYHSKINRIRKLYYVASYRSYPTRVFLYYTIFPMTTMAALIFILIYFDRLYVLFDR